MVGCRVVFRKVVGKVGASFGPVDEKVALADTVADPIKSHVHRFRATLLDRVIGNAGSSAVVGLHGSWTLRMAEFFEGSADRAALLAVVE